MLGWMSLICYFRCFLPYTTWICKVEIFVHLQMHWRRCKVDGAYVVTFGCFLPYANWIRKVEIRVSANVSNEARINPQKDGN